MNGLSPPESFPFAIRPTDPGPFYNNRAYSYMPGFQDGSTGDSILIPTTSTGSFTKYNAAGTAQTDGDWASSLLLGDLAGTRSNWCGVMMDGTDDLMYFVAVGSSGGINYRLFSINDAGTVTDISGSDQAPATAFTTTPLLAQTTYTSLVRLGGDGSGHFRLYNFASDATGAERGQYLDFNSSTGAKIGDTTDIISSDYGQNLNATGFWTATPEGIAMSQPALTDGEVRASIVNVANGKLVMNATLGRGGEFPHAAASGYPMQWNGNYVIGSPNNQAAVGPRAVDAGVFRSHMTKVASFYGIL